MKIESDSVLESALLAFLPKERVKTKLIDTISYASDAGFYQLIPKAVVLAENEIEIRQLFKLSQQLHVPITFRTGGTSLSGQAISDGILVDLSQHWRSIQVLEEGKFVKVQPGVIGQVVNLHLKKYGRKMGPDPSSIASAMMGGILSNNSSGMCCGVRNNSYHTTDSFIFILPNGTSYNTANAEDYTRFELESSDLYKTIQDLRAKILENQTLSEKIRNKYQTKNTVGYGLNAFLDFEHPLDIFAHLLIGAEGTLAFIAEATLKTLVDLPLKSTAMVFFEDIFSACEAIPALIETGAEAVELMDRASLRSIEALKGVPQEWKSFPEATAALLIEYQDVSEHELLQKTNAFIEKSAFFKLLNRNVVFTRNPQEQAFLWKLRKGMFPAVGAIRAQGTSVILEDVAFPLEKLAPAVKDLQALFQKFEYHNAIIFGHAKDANLHFVVTQSFNTEAEVFRYEKFIDAVVDLVVHTYHGALKAEHGTGRNMAPFVETEWGTEAYDIMKTLKEAVDPMYLLNPGVIINRDPKAHLKDLKPLPVVESEVDQCIECGYCEHNCPSRDLTMTPRRRIVARRALATLKSEGKLKDYQQLLEEYQYHGLDTCAVDGLCATDCPVNINTGELVKRLRRESHSDFAKKTAVQIAKQFKWTEKGIKTGLKTGEMLNKSLGKNTMVAITKTMRQLGFGNPNWSNQLASPPMLIPQKPTNPDAVYYVTCISRVMGNGVPGKPSLMQTVLNVCRKAGISILIPENLEGSCCGQPFASKGFVDAQKILINQTVENLYTWSNEGKLPILIDGSSCSYTFLQSRAYLSAETQTKFDALKFHDSVDFATQMILPTLKITQKKQSIAFHPLCSLTKMNLKHHLETIGKACAKEMFIPMHAGCCGMAGDRGFLFPELTQSAVKEEVTELNGQVFDGYYSSGKTCEISLSEQSGKAYESIFYLLDEVS